MRSCASGFMCSSVRMLSRRSESLTSSTRMSRAIATTILRKFSAWRSSLRGEVDLAELGDAVDEERDLVAELALDVLGGRRRVLDHVVQQRRADAGRVEVQLRDDVGDADRMDEVRVARLAQLALCMRAA